MFWKIAKLCFASVSLVREHLRGLRENQKHKNQPKESCKRRNNNKGGRIVGGIKARSGKTFALSFYMSKTILGLSKLFWIEQQTSAFVPTK